MEFGIGKYGKNLYAFVLRLSGTLCSNSLEPWGDGGPEGGRVWRIYEDENGKTVSEKYDFDDMADAVDAYQADKKELATIESERLRGIYEAGNFVPEKLGELLIELVRCALASGEMTVDDLDEIIRKMIESMIAQGGRAKEEGLTLLAKRESEAERAAIEIES